MHKSPKCYALRSGTRSLVLFTGTPSSSLVKSIHASKTQVGLAVSSGDLPDADTFDGFDYLFLATRTDRETPIKMALRDLSRRRWNPIGVGRGN